MPAPDNIVNIPGFKFKKATGYSPVILHVDYTIKPKCPDCHSNKLRTKDKRTRFIQHVPFEGRKSFLQLTVHEYKCQHCHRYFHQQLNGVGKYQRATEKLKKYASKLHELGINQKGLAQELRIGSATVERWYHQ